MKDNVYRNAVEHLRFAEDLEQTVLEKAGGRRSRFRISRVAAVAAILCLLLGTTVFAAEHIAERHLRFREEGRIRYRFLNTEVMEFSLSEDLRRVKVHQMELKPKGYYHFGEGMISHPTEGFLKVTEDYHLEKLEYRSLETCFEKNGRTYGLEMNYVEVDGGIYSNLLNYYPVTDDEILVNMTAEGSHGWPVYVNIKTSVCRDALPLFTEADFLPDKLESGYEARIGYTQPFRDGILISALVSGIRNGNSDHTSFHYWIQEGSKEAVKLDLPKNCRDYIIEDAFYYQDTAGSWYMLDENFQSRELDGIPNSTDDLSCGLLTACSADGPLEIVDVIHPLVYYCSDITVGENTLWDTTGYNATRNSPDGKIVVTHSYNDYEASNRPLDSIAYLDLAAGEFIQLQIDTNCRVQTHGWLDDDRYCVIYEDGLKRYLAVYEFA